MRSGPRGTHRLTSWTRPPCLSVLILTSSVRVCVYVCEVCTCVSMSMGVPLCSHRGKRPTLEGWLSSSPRPVSVAVSANTPSNLAIGMRRAQMFATTSVFFPRAAGIRPAQQVLHPLSRLRGLAWRFVFLFLFFFFLKDKVSHGAWNLQCRLGKLASEPAYLASTRITCTWVFRSPPTCSRNFTHQVITPTQDSFPKRQYRQIPWG